jgi:beta-glucosidase
MPAGTVSPTLPNPRGLSRTPPPCAPGRFQGLAVAQTERLALSRADFPARIPVRRGNLGLSDRGPWHGGAGVCEWDTFAATPGNVARAEDGRVACDHYHRFAGDLDLCAGAGFDAYRFSTSWARVMPEGRGAVNAAGLDFYDRLVDAACERGLKPFLTLYHWELPAALADLGGWRNRDIAGWFGDFATVVGRRIGDRVHAAAPINEPWCVAWLSISSASTRRGCATSAPPPARCTMSGWPMAPRSGDARAGHGQSRRASSTWNTPLPADDSPGGGRRGARYDAIYNRFFLSGMLAGRYPDAVLAGLGPHLPEAGRTISPRSFRRRSIGSGSTTTPASGSRPQTGPGRTVPNGRGRCRKPISAGKSTPTACSTS